VKNLGRLVEIYRPWEKPGHPPLSKEGFEEVIKEIKEGAMAEIEGKRARVELSQDRHQTSAPAQKA